MINLGTKIRCISTGALCAFAYSALLFVAFSSREPEPEPPPETKSEQFDVMCYSGGHVTFEDVIVASMETPMEIWSGGMFRGTTTDGFTIWAHSCVATPIGYGE